MDFTALFLFKCICHTKFARVDSTEIDRQSILFFELKNIRRISTFRAKALRRPYEGPNSLETSNFPLYFAGSCISTNESLFKQYYLAFNKLFVVRARTRLKNPHNFTENQYFRLWKEIFF